MDARRKTVESLLRADWELQLGRNTFQNVSPVWHDARRPLGEFVVTGPKLTVDALKAEAVEFAKLECAHDEASIYGATDGKAVGTYLEHKFRSYLAERYTFGLCHQRTRSAPLPPESPGAREPPGGFFAHQRLSRRPRWAHRADPLVVDGGVRDVLGLPGEGVAFRRLPERRSSAALSAR
jgi:hypothetical protein